MHANDWAIKYQAKFFCQKTKGHDKIRIDSQYGLAIIFCYYNNRRIGNTPVVLFSILLPKLQ